VPDLLGAIMTVKRMDNVGIVVEDIDAAIRFFTELGLTLEGRMPIDGEWAGRVAAPRRNRCRHYRPLSGSCHPMGRRSNRSARWHPTAGHSRPERLARDERARRDLPHSTARRGEYARAADLPRNSSACAHTG
jgi:catechol 2,3-dioxygenase-like lactoylglutathione lyase family enzyme